MNARYQDLKHNALKFGIFLILGIAIIVVIPNKTVDPWNLINPKLLVLVVVMVMALQFFSYAIIELWKKEGLLIMGGLIGVVNSNVINGTMASISKQNPVLSDHAAAAVACGNLAMLIRNIIIVSTLSFSASKFIFAPLLAMLFTGIIVIYARIKSVNKKIKGVDVGIENPFAMKTAIRFAIVITSVTVIGFFIHQLFGDVGLYATAFISVYAAGGPIIISSIMLAAQGHIPYLTAAIVIMIASFSSCSNDAILQLLCGAKPLALSFLKLTIPMIAAGFIALGIQMLILG